VSTVVDETDGDWGRATATFSSDRRHRYELTRQWSGGGATSPRLVNFVMLNPSTADAFALDPTNRRCVGFAGDWGFDGLLTTNVFAWRSTDPRHLGGIDDPIGPDNDRYLVAAALRAELVVAAWGVHARLGGRGDRVRQLLADVGVDLHVLRLTKDGHPGHPLYLPTDTAPLRWP